MGVVARRGSGWPWSRFYFILMSLRNVSGTFVEGHIIFGGVD